MSACSAVGQSASVVRESQKVAAQVMGAKGYTLQQKAAYLYNAALKMWDQTNDPSVKSAFYQRLAQAGISNALQAARPGAVRPWCARFV